MSSSQAFCQLVDLGPAKSVAKELSLRDPVTHHGLFLPPLADCAASQVCLAVDRQSKAEVAVKVYPKSWVSANPGLFENEVKSYIRLEPFHISPALLHNPAKSENNTYLFMELCNRGSLDMILQRTRQPFDPAYVREVAAFLSSAVTTMHNCGLVHHEVSPRHILVSVSPGSHRYSLVGMKYTTQVSREETYAAAIRESPYIAPETKPGFATDVWGIGVTLYELAAGDLPGKIDPEFVPRVKAGKPVRFPAGVDADLCELIGRCLVLDPERRIRAEQIVCERFIAGDCLCLPMISFKPTEPAQKAASGPVERPIEAEPFDQENISTDFVGYIKHVNRTKNWGFIFKTDVWHNYGQYSLKQDEGAIGRGEYSEIFLCEHQITKVVYAIKMIYTNRIRSDKPAELLLGEIPALYAMKDIPFAIQIRDYFMCDKTLCIIMDYCNGGDLYSYMKRRQIRSLSLELLKLVAWNVACALEAMHKRRIMHRDVRPRNVLVVEDKASGEMIDVVLSDFGLSKHVRDGEFRGDTILGVRSFMAPEVRLKDYNWKVDVWSYGALLYYIVYGETLGQPEEDSDIPVESSPITFKDAPGVPQTYIELMKRCLTFDVSKRPNFSDLLTDPFFTVVVFPPPRQSIEPYMKKELLGRSSGGKTEVYRCVKGNREYALKILDTRGIADSQTKQLRDEIDTLTKLMNCTNIVRLFEYFRLGESVCLILEYYAEGSLSRYVAARERVGNPLTFEEQITVARSTLLGISAIHAHKIIHRDIHPNNLLVAVEPHTGSLSNVVIADFGFARVLVDEAAKTSIPNEYNSPELALAVGGGNYDEKTDVWSYGMLLYFVLFAVHAGSFLGNNMNEIRKVGLAKLRYDEKRTGISTELLGMMRRCLRVRASERPSAGDLLRDPVFARLKPSSK